MGSQARVGGTEEILLPIQQQHVDENPNSVGSWHPLQLAKHFPTYYVCITHYII